MDDHTIPARGPSVRSLALRVVIALAAVVGAVFAAYFAGLIDWLACENDTSEACERRDLAELQFRLALIGLGPTIAFASAFVARWRRVAAAMFIVAAATYVVWAVFADAAVHGWDELKLFPS